ncbi:hypothetical protein PV11_09481 [Exophiala sideris]|uniref:Uncharacterized protein n=1 Tax=Exophiala sideris TaxID=1016849 RepID=A0A0D1YRX6_9EURO|nr:hypothetical protein PV11_09481 [Exophiala sideris]
MASSVPVTRKPAHLEVPPSPLERPKPHLSRTNTHRLPPPALFQGPPSKNASHVSLSLPGGDRPAGTETDHSLRPPRPSRVPAAASFSGPSLKQPAAETDDRRAENLWVEMQKTLADVEVSAMNTSHVFGASHAKALEDLRTAQLSLAQTWAKSEADELHEPEPNITPDSATIGHIDQGASPVKGKGSDGKPSAFTNNKNLEEETERDIQLARKRREANDRYFEQVNRGVLDVVSKLDEVAGAMRRVERESREIWDESTEDDLSASETGSGTDHTGLTDSPLRTAKPR